MSRARKTGRGGTGKAQRSLLRRMIRRLLQVLLVLLLVPAVLLPLYRYVNPPLSSVMILKRLGGASIIRQWADIDEISPNLVRAVLVSEDGRFCGHNGIDLKEVEAVLENIGDGGSPRGASTITMQVVKNLFLWSDRSVLRKGLEVPLALYAELVLPKRRIMEIYLNIVEWDRGVYGAEAASRRYFNRPASRISAAQAAHLAVTLPAPVSRNAAEPNRQMRRLAAIVAQRAERSGGYATCILN